MNLILQLNRKVIIRLNLMLIFIMIFQLSVFEPERRITGSLTDKTGETLACMDVFLKDTTNGDWSASFLPQMHLKYTY